MAIHIPNAAYDAYFAHFSACTRLSLVGDESTPTDLTGELVAETLAGGDFSTGAGDPTGRRLTVAQKPNVAVAANGTTRHAVLSYTADAGATWTPRLITTCSQRVVSNTEGDHVNMTSFYLQVIAPAAV